jgi:hypothetical protein
VFADLSDADTDRAVAEVAMRRMLLGITTVLLPAMLAIVVCNEVARAIEPANTKRGEPVPAAPEPTAPPTERELADWVRDLGNPAYAVRDKAQAKLTAAGELALDPITRAVTSTEPEVRQRAVEILRRHAAGTSEPIGTKARVALEDLSRSEDMAVARAASSAMATNDRKRQEAQLEATTRDRMMVRGGRAVFMPGKPLVVARARAIAIAPGATSLQISVVNGKRSLIAKADGQKVEISDGGDDKGGIKMSITKKVDGKEVKESFTAKDADELKTKHAEAYKVYEKYTKPAAKPPLKAIVDPAEIWKGALPKQAAPPKAAAPPKLPPVEHTDVPPAIPAPRK